MTPKYKVGQRVRLLPIPLNRCQYPQFINAITTITFVNVEPPLSIRRRYPDRVYYEVALITRRGNHLKVAEPWLAPVDDKPDEIGSWETITKLLGIDIRKEPIHVKA